MTRDWLNTVIAVLTIGGALVGVWLVGWLVHIKANGGEIAAVSTLVGSLINQAAGIVRNRFPGPEIDVTPPTTKDTP